MLSLIILSVGLAMDAVAVSLVRGATGEHRLSRAIEVAVFFGLAQGVMPLVGWSIGVAFSSEIETVAHWVAFVLLGFLGSRMLFEAAARVRESRTSSGRSHYWGLAIAALATSIDAAAAGITLPIFEQPIARACVVIGIVTAALCVPAYWIGARASRNLGSISEVIGGIFLIGLGTKILVEHLAL